MEIFTERMEFKSYFEFIKIIKYSYFIWKFFSTVDQNKRNPDRHSQILGSASLEDDQAVRLIAEVKGDTNSEVTAMSSLNLPTINNNLNFTYFSTGSQ